MKIPSFGGVASSAGVGGFNPTNPPLPPAAASPPGRGITRLFSSAVMRLKTLWGTSLMKNRFLQKKLHQAWVAFDRTRPAAV